jgi:hypothetical protein
MRHDTKYRIYRVPDFYLKHVSLLRIPDSLQFFMISKFILQSVVIHLAEWNVRLQWFGERHSVEPVRKYWVVVLGDNS